MYEDGIVRGTFNNKTFVPPLTPSILSMTTLPPSYATNAASYGPYSNAVVASHMQMVEMVILNFSKDKHPFHLHGTKFQVVNKVSDLRTMDRKKNPPLRENQKNPVRRDTVAVPSGGSVTIRFRADNPGAWIMHCHMDWHLSAGMAMLMIQAPDQASSLHVPKVLKDQCKMQGFPISGNAGGIPNSTIAFGSLSVPPPLAH